MDPWNCDKFSRECLLLSENERVRKCHLDQLRDRDVEESSTSVITPDEISHTENTR